jgi:acetoin utilization deacetylase AcuC-like enzyme
MHVYVSDHHVVPLPPGHRFPMGKYAALRERLLARGLVAPGELVAAEPARRSELVAAHTPGYVDEILAGHVDERVMRQIGFPWSEALVARSLASVGGTLMAARRALQDGIAANLAGGTHHAFADRGAGFCVWNDLAVCARTLLADGAVGRVLIVDVDVHQGDGTAAILAGDERVFTLSIHGQKNFPFRKQRSSLDVELPDGTGDEAYLMALAPALARGFAAGRPDLVLVQAGVDPLAGDRLGRLALSPDGLYARDEQILATCRAHGVPVALTLGGGYAEPIAASVEAHAGTYAAVRAIYG